MRYRYNTYGRAAAASASLAAEGARSGYMSSHCDLISDGAARALAVGAAHWAAQTADYAASARKTK